jgi:regulator of protease activity HflC (stomatin/prohibitin superfamily)
MQFFTLLIVISAIGYFAHRGVLTYIRAQNNGRYDKQSQPSYSSPMTTGAALGLLFIAFSSYTIIQTNQVGVGRSFGATYESAYMPGINLKAPWTTVTKHEVLRQEFPFAGVVTSKDNNPLTLDVGFAISLNPTLAWRVEETLGTNYFNSLVVPAGSTAVRIGLSRFGWVFATTTGREELTLAIEEEFRKVLIQQMISANLTEIEAKTALTIFPVQLRQALPDGKVLNAIAEKSASEQDKERQSILTEIAQIEAERRQEEGKGVTNLFKELPDGFSPEQIATVLSALATKTRADAMLKAVESGKIDNLIINGDSQSGPSTALATPRAAIVATTPSK